LPLSNELEIRVAAPADHAAIAALTVAAYRGDGQTHPDHPYEKVLADVTARAGEGTLLACADAYSGEVLGAVLFVLAESEYAEVCRPGQAEFRMLAVAPHAQRRGVGEALVRACVERAAALGCTAVVLSVRDFAQHAQRLYTRLGFTRDPALDWYPIEGVALLGMRYDFSATSS